MITLKNLLCDTPPWLLGLLVIVGVTLLISGTRRQLKGLARAGFGVLAVAIVLAALSFFVDTDQEKVIKRTKQLVAAVEKRDTATVSDLLHPDVRLESWTKADIIEGSKAYADQMGLVSARINNVEAKEQDADLVTVSLSVTAQLKEAAYGNIPTSWDLRWVRTPQGWLLRDIRVKPAAPGQDTEQLRSIFERPR